MHVNSLIAKSKLFNDLVIESGFKRDLEDYYQSIQQGYNQNLLFMKDVSKRIQDRFFEFENQGLDVELDSLLRDSSFIKESTVEKLVTLDLDTTIEANEYYQTLNIILTELIAAINKDEIEIHKLTDVLLKYVDEEYEEETGLALMALVFKDLKTTGNLKEFSKAIAKWNRTLLIFHTLVKSDSPSEIKLEGIQDGSIEVVCNIDANVTADLAEVFGYGVKAFGMYLAYKSKFAKEVLEMFKGNKKLAEHEKETEKLLIDAIKDNLSEKITSLHKAKLKTDTGIDKSSSDKKIEEVVAVIIDHIIKGNELKLLSNVPMENNDEENVATNLRRQMSVVREHLKKMTNDDLTLLLDTLGLNSSEMDEDQTK